MNAEVPEGSLDYDAHQEFLDYLRLNEIFNFGAFNNLRSLIESIYTD